MPSRKDIITSSNDIERVATELECKIDKLITQYKRSLEKVEQQKLTIDELSEELSTLKSENKRLKEELKTSRLAKAISRGSGDTDAKAKIESLVREIDKCIALIDK